MAVDGAGERGGIPNMPTGRSGWSGLPFPARVAVVALGAALSVSGAFARLAVGLGCSGHRCSVSTTAALGLGSYAYAFAACAAASVLIGAVARGPRTGVASLAGGVLPFFVASGALLALYVPRPW